MTYIDEIAEDIQRLVDPTRLPRGDTEPLFRIYAVLALTKGQAVTAEDVHDAWSAWMSERKPEHPSLRPFQELSQATQEEDEPYAQAIRRVAATRVARH